MEVEQVALRLIPLLYDAAVHQGDVLQFADALTCELGDFSAGVALRLPGLERPHVMVTSDDDLAANRAYGDHYHALDPKLACMSRTRPGVLAETTRELRVETFSRTEFYNDFVLPFQRAWGPHYAAVIACEAGRPAASFFARNRRPGSQDEISGGRRRLLEILIPHVANARRVWASLEESAARDEGLCSALDHMQMGVILLDASRRIRWVSFMAETILSGQDGLRVSSGELHADAHGEDACLQREIAAASGAGSVAGLGSGCAIALSRASGCRALEVVVAPVGRESSLRTIAPTGGALVFVLDPEVSLPDEYEVLRALYGFTAAETLFARMLADDLSLAEAAERAGITEQTARDRLKTLFGKTGTHRQASLVRLLVRGPASLALRPRAPGAAGGGADPPATGILRLL